MPMKETAQSFDERPSEGSFIMKRAEKKFFSCGVVRSQHEMESPSPDFPSFPYFLRSPGKFIFPENTPLILDEVSHSRKKALRPQA